MNYILRRLGLIQSLWSSLRWVAFFFIISTCSWSFSCFSVLPWDPCSIWEELCTFPEARHLKKTQILLLTYSIVIYFLNLCILYNQPKEVKGKKELKRKNTIFSYRYYKAYTEVLKIISIKCLEYLKHYNWAMKKITDSLVVHTEKFIFG